MAAVRSEPEVESTSQAVIVQEEAAAAAAVVEDATQKQEKFVEAPIPKVNPWTVSRKGQACKTALPGRNQLQTGNCRLLV